MKKGLAEASRRASVHHAFGLAHVRRREEKAAFKSFARAATLELDNARHAYVRAVALHSFGRTPEALRAMERAVVRWPRDRDVLFALATVRWDAGRREAARAAARALVAAHPDDHEARALAAQLE